MSKKRAKKGVESEKTKQIKALLKLGVSGTDVAKRLSVTRSSVYSIAKYYRQEIDSAKLVNKQVDIADFDKANINTLKHNILVLGNTITDRLTEKTSLSQVATTYGIMFDKLRLAQGKSTSNSAVDLMVNINPEGQAILKETIKSLKESMLRNE